MKRYLFGLLTGLLLPLTALAQTERVGVNTRTPTEDMDVKGSLRIQTLPKKGEGITTNASGNYDSGKGNLYAPDRVLVANQHGVVGMMNAVWPLFFYMPSIVLPTDTSDPAYLGTAFEIDLYQKYYDQFTPSPIPSAYTARNPSATTPLPVVARGDLDYFVTYYDNAVFSNVQVDDTGRLRYSLVNPSSPDVTEKTFMNVVFRRK